MDDELTEGQRIRVANNEPSKRGIASCKGFIKTITDGRYNVLVIDPLEGGWAGPYVIERQYLERV